MRGGTTFDRSREVLLTTLFLTTRCLELVPLLPSERVGNRTCAINHPLLVYLTWSILMDTFAHEKQHCSEESRHESVVMGSFYEAFATMAWPSSESWLQ